MENAATSAGALGAVTAYLEVTSGEAVRPTVFPIHDEVLIGRDPQDSLASDKFLCIPEHTVSRRHARIRRRGDSYFVEDLHSFNGTFVDGNKLKPGAWHALKDGDELTISSAQMVFHSLMVPARDNMPTIITKMVDASELTRIMDPLPKASQSDMQQTVQKLHAMAQVGIALGAVTDRETLIEKIMKFIFELFPLADRAFVLLTEAGGGGEPRPLAVRRRDGSVENLERVRLSRTIVDEVFNKKQAILSVDTLSDRHFGAQESIVSQAIRSVMCVPLVHENECLGLIQVDASSDPYAFKEQDLEMLTGVCAEAAVALKNFQLYSDIERLLDGFVRASVQAIEERDPATAGHSFRVAGYAEGLAQAVDRDDAPDLRRIGFSHEQLREIRYAALLHDFGKVGVREHVLRKEKKLHHYEMRMLEERFKHARACLEREAYRALVELHARQDLSIGAFRGEKRKIEAFLEEEFSRLAHFLGTIRQANEPAVSHGGVLPDLQAILDYAYCDADGCDAALLHEHEFSALSLPKGCLTAEERRQIESHVADSYSFLVLIPWTRDLASVPAIAHGHHEKLDGSGYPMGLRGPQISMQTRILTICDIYDALTAGDRPYKKAVPVEKALDLIGAECRAGHLDQRLFRVFVEARVWAAA
ncbi:MAG TPA: HD domain-containing phosphohydrolase [Noviherbaspirillum sp.]|uniref:HD domain-containing phosphohydrolase n=1 Tax=Noviherbaspirillum sp. TaxID=1926288 RepID=UPI002D66D574|nr:HD domain-containing phosphohydrolase [Noviherbaspirillum sp.]HYD96150.1 HD domain-containing phosphohydrolase [Noviherbaspirillum sp.]